MGQNRFQNYIFGRFLNISSLVFLYFAQDNSLEQCLTTVRGKTHDKNYWSQIWTKQVKIGSQIKFFIISSCMAHEFCLKLHRNKVWNKLGTKFYNQQRQNYHKKFQAANLGEIFQNQARNQLFCHFSSYTRYFYCKLHLIIAWKNFQLLVKIKFKKNFLGTQIWGKHAKIGSEIRFFAIFSSFVNQFLTELHRMIAWNNVLLLVEVKFAKKKWGPKFWSNWLKSDPNLGFWPFCEVWFISFP